MATARRARSSDSVTPTATDLLARRFAPNLLYPPDAARYARRLADELERYGISLARSQMMLSALLRLARECEQVPSERATELIMDPRLSPQDLLPVARPRAKAAKAKAKAKTKSKAKAARSRVRTAWQRVSEDD